MKESGIGTIIGKGTQLRGVFHFTGAVRLDGVLEGTVEHVGSIVVGPEGRLHADISCTEMEIAGEVRGDVVVVGRLEIHASGRLYGDIRCGRLVVHEGGIFDGRSLVETKT